MNVVETLTHTHVSQTVRQVDTFMADKLLK